MNIESLDSPSLDKIADKHAQTQACLNRTNDLRSIHSSDPLTLSSKLCDEAQKWAEELAKKDGLEHSSKEDRINQGENLSGHTGSQDITNSVDRWYEEEKDYNYKKPKFQGHTGHFTQTVWQDTKEFGIGWAVSATGWTYVVARYSPPGNMTITPPGEAESYKNNVKKPDKTLAKTFKKMTLKNEENKKVRKPTQNEIDEFVREVNKYRSKHQSEALEEDDDLTESAQAWTDKLAAQDKAENGQEDDQGECLYSYSGPQFKLSGAVKAWYSGGEKYNFEDPSWQGGCGNFTQLVWASTKTVGIGVSQSNSGKVFVCARFQPPGNLVITPPGEEATFRKNVMPSS